MSGDKQVLRPPMLNVATWYHGKLMGVVQGSQAALLLPVRLPEVNDSAALELKQILPPAAVDGNSVWHVAGDIPAQRVPWRPRSLAEYESSFSLAQGLEHDPRIETTMDRTIEDIMKKLVGGYAKEYTAQAWQPYYWQFKLMATARTRRTGSRRIWSACQPKGRKQPYLALKGIRAGLPIAL